MLRTRLTQALAIILVLLPVGCARRPPVAQVPGDGTWQDAMIAVERSSAGVLGVEVLDLGSGKRRSWRAEETFPMASTFKVAVALAVLRRVDRGDLRLADVAHVTPADLRPGMGDGLAERFPNGFDLSIANLAAAMVEESDNTACDALLAHIGGPTAVMAMLRDLGVSGLRVDRAELDLGHDIDTEGAAFSRDPRDQTTPLAMAGLLQQIVTGKAASPASTATLVGWLEATKTGAARLRAGLPAGARLAHKTGTYGDGNGPNATNDVGMVTRADGSRAIVVVYLRDAKGSLEDRERAIADVARAVLANGS
jgi:beta-lactamase class A